LIAPDAASARSKLPVQRSDLDGSLTRAHIQQMTPVVLDMDRRVT
jgi:hypothetical protein